MSAFWNNGEKDIIKGLDILGLRGVDQHIETQLVASITTISIRARYLSLIPWLIGEFIQPYKNKTNLDRDKMRHLLMHVFDRMELVIILSTYHEKKKDPNIIDTGIIGKEVHEDHVKEFDDKGVIHKTILKDRAKNESYINPSYGTYYNPCRGFGLLDHSSTTPVTLLPNGIAIYEVRKQHVIRDGGVLDWLLHGGKLTKSMIIKESELFSVGNINSIPEEMILLQESFLTSYNSSNQDVDNTYKKFNHTLLWVLERLEEPKKPQQLIYDNFTHCTSQTLDNLEEIEIFWFEFELRRRVHYSLELLLKALAHTLDELNGATVEKTLERWLEDIEFSDVYSDGRSTYEAIVLDLHTQVEDDVYFNKEPIVAHEQALHAISLLEVCRLQSENLLSGLSKVDIGIDYMRKTFEILKTNNDRKVYEVLIEIIKYCVVEPHLKTTLRKMGQGQQCSLRFFPEGQKLIPTGIDTYAGWSGSRLDNTMRMMSDIGMCEQVENNTYKKNEMSDHVISRLREMV